MLELTTELLFLRPSKLITFFLPHHLNWGKLSWLLDRRHMKKVGLVAGSIVKAIGKAAGLEYTSARHGATKRPLEWWIIFARVTNPRDVTLFFLANTISYVHCHERESRGSFSPVAFFCKRLLTYKVLRNFALPAPGIDTTFFFFLQNGAFFLNCLSIIVWYTMYLINKHTT